MLYDVMDSLRQRVTFIHHRSSLHYQISVLECCIEQAHRNLLPLCCNQECPGRSIYKRRETLNVLLVVMWESFPALDILLMCIATTSDYLTPQIEALLVM